MQSTSADGALSSARPQVALLWDGQERGRMYGAYALSALMTPQSPVDGLLAAGVIPALVAVLNTSRVRLAIGSAGPLASLLLYEELTVH